MCLYTHHRERIKTMFIFFCLTFYEKIRKSETRDETRRAGCVCVRNFSSVCRENIHLAEGSEFDADNEYEHIFSLVLMKKRYLRLGYAIYFNELTTECTFFSLRCMTTAPNHTKNTGK